MCTYMSVSRRVATGSRQPLRAATSSGGLEHQLPVGVAILNGFGSAGGAACRDFRREGGCVWFGMFFFAFGREYRVGFEGFVGFRLVSFAFWREYRLGFRRLLMVFALYV